MEHEIKIGFIWGLIGIFVSAMVLKSLGKYDIRVCSTRLQDDIGNHVGPSFQEVDAIALEAATVTCDRAGQLHLLPGFQTLRLCSCDLGIGPQCYGYRDTGKKTGNYCVGFCVLGFRDVMLLMENQMAKGIEHEMATALVRGL